MQGTLNFVVYGLNPAVRAEWSRALGRLKGVFQVAGARRSEFELEPVEHFSIDRRVPARAASRRRARARARPLSPRHAACRPSAVARARSLRSSSVGRRSSEVERASTAAQSESDAADAGADGDAARAPNPLRE